MKLNIKNNIFYRLYVLLKNRFGRGGFRNFYELIGFLLLIFPPFNLIFSIFLKSIKDDKNFFLKNFLFNMLNIGIGWGSLRYLDPRKKNYLGEHYNLYQIKKRDLKLYNKNIIKDFDCSLNEIKTLGYTNFGNYFNSKEVSEVKKHFLNAPFYTSQVPDQGRKIEKGFLIKDSYTDSRMRSVESSITLSCNLISKFLASDKILDFLKSYFGYLPQLHNINTFATMPSSSSHYVMSPHRDYDHLFGLTVFIAWTKTSKDNGATMYLNGSNNSSKAKDAKYTALDCNPGDVYLVDTFGKHYGNPMVKDMRFATWFRYGTIPNYSYLLNKPFFIDTESL